MKYKVNEVDKHKNPTGLYLHCSMTMSTEMELIMDNYLKKRHNGCSIEEHIKCIIEQELLDILFCHEDALEKANIK